jgi:hypothetical protein
MSEGDDFYTIWRAAELLDVPTEKVHGLVRKGKLKARRDEQTGRWLLDARSIHGRLKGSRVDPQGTSGIATTAAGPDGSRGESRFFDLLILLIIGATTLLAAGYTLVPLLHWG